MSAEGGGGGPGGASSGGAGIGSGMGMGGARGGAGIRGGLGGESGMGASIGSVSVGGKTNVETLNPVGAIPSISAEHSTAVNTISGKTGGSFDKFTTAADIFGAPEYKISQSAFNTDTATPMPTEAAISSAIDTAIQDAEQDLAAKAITIINEAGYNLTPNKSPIKGPLPDIFQTTVSLTGEYKHTDTAVRDLESLKKEFEVLYVNPEIATTKPAAVREAEQSVVEKPETEPAQKTKAVFKEYAATYILPHINEIKAENENQPETTTKTDSLLKVVDGEIQLTPQEITKVNQKQELKLTVKDQIELMTDVEQAVKTQELYIAIGYQTDAAAALAIHALHQTLARKGLEVKVTEQVKNAAETLQKTKDRPATKTELAPLVDEEAKKELKKKARNTELPQKKYRIKDEKAQAARIEALDRALNQVVTKEKLKQEDAFKKPEITGKSVIEIMAATETNRQRSQIVQPMGTDWSLPGDDGVYTEGNYLEAAEPDKIRQEIIGIMDRKPPVEETDVPVSQEVTDRDVERVVRRGEIKPKVIEIYNASRQKPA